MQNDHMTLPCVAYVLQLIRRCLAQVGGWFVFPQSSLGWFGLGAFSLSADLDSARLDVVSRSLLWNCGSSERRAVPVVVRSRICAPVHTRWRGGPPETLPRWDH
ncbi:MAG: hypothetical protein JSS02_22280 [Planctomycetes bacterium]|nr:hypothetical protein [Planctomycetota bacterium]